MLRGDCEMDRIYINTIHLAWKSICVKFPSVICFSSLINAKETAYGHNYKKPKGGMQNHVRFTYRDAMYAYIKRGLAKSLGRHVI